MTNSMTQAQLAQQNNRTADGKYTTKQHSEAEVDLGLGGHNVIEVEDGDSYEIDYALAHSGDVYSRAEIVNSDGYFVEGTIYENFHHCLPPEVDKWKEHYSDDQISDYLNNRAHIITGVINERYKNVDLDPGPTDTFAFDFSVPLDGPPASEEEAFNKLWDESDGVKFRNEMDPGTFGHENVSRLIAERLEAYDNTKLPNPETVDAEAKQRFIDDFMSSAELDMQMTAEDVYASEHEELIDGSELRFDVETRQKLEKAAGKFYENNAGDLAAWGEVKDNTSTPFGGHDAYLVAANSGAGFTDRVSFVNDIESSVLASRLEKSSLDELPSLEGNYGFEDGRIYFEGLD